jgi:GNAT superfamily N-acetyltransferase
MYTDLSSVPLILTTGAAIAMVLLIVVRQLSGGYLALAESINWEWLGDSEILVAEWGEEPNKQVIGAVVFKEESFGTGKKKGKKGVVRAWTVRLRERGRGVGRGLLEELCKVGRGRGWADVGLEEGVYDKKVLWSVWHSVFERRARRGRAVLGSVWEEVGGGKGAR